MTRSRISLNGFWDLRQQLKVELCSLGRRTVANSRIVLTLHPRNSLIANCNRFAREALRCTIPVYAPY